MFIREFMDGFFALGMIPISMARWEMTGLWVHPPQNEVLVIR